jgi:hypothetical protein
MINNGPGGAWVSRPAFAMPAGKWKDMAVVLNASGKLEVFFVGERGIFHMHD